LLELPHGIENVTMNEDLVGVMPLNATMCETRLNEDLLNEKQLDEMTKSVN
jgi:hypothetical protein